MDRAFEDLINREIDGTITPQERSRLLAYLETDPEAKGYREDLSRLARVLAEAPRAEVPDELRPRILRALRDAPRRSGFWSGVRQEARSLAPSRRLRYGMSFAFGLVVGIAALGIYIQGTRSTSQVDPSVLTGTLVPREPPAAETASRAFDLGTASGTLSWGSESGHPVAEVQIRSSKEVEIEIGYDTNVLTLVGFTQDGSAAIRLDESVLAVRHEGDATYRFKWVEKAAGSTVTIRFRSEVGSHEMRLPGADGWKADQ